MLDSIVMLNCMKYLSRIDGFEGKGVNLNPSQYPRSTTVVMCKWCCASYDLDHSLLQPKLVVSFQEFKEYLTGGNNRGLVTRIVDVQGNHPDGRWACP